MESKKNTILIPTDFSSVAENALDHAINVAKTFGNEICIMHIFEDSFIGNIWGQKNSYKDGIVGQMLQEKLDGMSKDILEKHQVKTRAVITTGKIYKTIIEFVEDDANDIESIIMGTSGAEGFKQIIGSNASRVISMSKVPVVVVREKQYGNGYKNIVMPIDLTLESKQKVSWAITLAKKYEAVIHVVTIKESDEFIKSRIHANLNQVENVLEQNGVKFTVKLLDEDGTAGPVDDFIEYAESINADLIMIMSQQEREGLSEFVIGSYAQQIVNQSKKIPVLAIAPKKTGMHADLWSGM
jgi:nucleotide-binding universal stress UspA family protein